MSWVRRFLSSALEAIYPSACEVCGTELVDGEELMCLKCQLKMPLTHIHSGDFNQIHQRLARTGLPIEHAGSLFYYVRDNEYARLIQRSKYNSRPSIDRALARMFVKEVGSDGFFEGVDVLVPVPMHFLKVARRGFNQSHEICKAVSELTGIAVMADNLRARRHQTQTRRGVAARQANVEGIISVVDGRKFAGKHVMVVDDVITTGATMLACLDAIHRAAPDARLSVMSLALTKRL